MCTSNLNTDTHAVFTSEDRFFLPEIPSPNKRGTPMVPLHRRRLSSLAGRLFPWHAHQQIPFLYFSLPWRCYSCRMAPGLWGPPGTSLSPQPRDSSCPRSPGVLGAEACSQEALVPAERVVLVTPTNWGIWEGFIITMYCFFLYCPATKTLSRIHPPHLSIWYFHYFIFHLVKHYQK